MKPMALSVALLCVTALAVIGHQAANVVNSSRSNIKNNLELPVISQGPDGKVQCKVADVACTKDQVEQLSKACATYNTTKGHSKSLKGVALAPNGSLTCVGYDSRQAPCTAVHLADLNNAAALLGGPNTVDSGAGKKSTAGK